MKRGNQKSGRKSLNFFFFGECTTNVYVNEMYFLLKVIGCSVVASSRRIHTRALMLKECISKHLAYFVKRMSPSMSHTHTHSTLKQMLLCETLLKCIWCVRCVLYMWCTCRLVRILYIPCSKYRTVAALARISRLQ